MNKLIVPTLTLTIAACGGDPSQLATAESAAFDQHAYDGYEVMTGGALVPYDDDPKVEVRINRDGDALTDDILPELSDAHGLDDIDLDDQTLISDTAPSGVTTLLACHNSSAVWELNMNDAVVRADIDPGTVITRFASGKRILTDLDMPDFSLEFELQFYWPYNVGGWYCNTFGSNYNIRVDVNVEGAEGSLDVTLDDVGGVPQIASIDDFELDVDSVTFDSSFLTSVTNIGLSVANLFGTGCSTMTSCVNQQLDENLSQRSAIKNALRDAINDALERTATIEGAVNFGVATLDYTVALDSISTNDTKDRLKTRWDVDFASNAPDALCAAGLVKARYPAPSDMETNDDFDVLIPFKKISDLFYTVGKQGDLCAPFTWSARGTAVNMVVKPAGSFRITTGAGSLLTATLPIEVDALLSPFASGAITGELAVTGRLVPVCGGGMQIVPTDVDLRNLTGSITYTPPFGTPVSLSATTFINSYRPAAETAIFNALLPGLNVLPSAFAIGDLGQYLEIGDVVTDSAGITVGLNVVESCQ